MAVPAVERGPGLGRVENEQELIMFTLKSKGGEFRGYVEFYDNLDDGPPESIVVDGVTYVRKDAQTYTEQS